MRAKKPRGVTPPFIELRQSEIHGLGVFATQALPAGTVIGRYAGRRYTEKEAAELEIDDAVTYLFSLSDGSVIDGGQEGNATRHLNHACEPNCEAEEMESDSGELEIQFQTLRKVRAGDELFIDYGLVIDESRDRSEYACACGSAQCRGTMAGPAEER
jgi:SET domain-containing protein